MKKSLFFLFFFNLFISSYAGNIEYSLDSININNLEYNKTNIEIFAPCILHEEDYIESIENNIKKKTIEDVISSIKKDDELDDYSKIKNYNKVDDYDIDSNDDYNIEKSDYDDIYLNLYSNYDDKEEIINIINGKIFTNLNKTNLYNINYNKNSCNNINKFFKENDTNDISDYILSSNFSSVDYILNYNVEIISDFEIKLQVFIWDIVDSKFVGGKYYFVNKKTMRKDDFYKISNKISDFIFQVTTGENGGLFDTRIAYVSESGDFKNRNKQIRIMNFDGSDNIKITDGNNLKLTPVFSRYNYNEIFYVEYTKDGVFVIKNNLLTNEVEKILKNGQDMTTAPAFNPNGENQIIVSASDENYGTNLFLFDFNKRTNKQITNNEAINTSASFSPDGKSIVYVSNKFGGRKLFTKNLETNEENVISSGNGIYDKPAWSPDGRLISFIKIFKGKFYLGIMTTNGEGERYLVSDYLIEGVKWSPNSRYLIYTKQSGAFGDKSIPKIYIMDVLTRNEYKLNTIELEGASDPDWIINK